MDLIRAAIVGAPGTPYHDGLFIFDIFLPLDYPHEPPVSDLLYKVCAYLLTSCSHKQLLLNMSLGRLRCYKKPRYSDLSKA